MSQPALERTSIAATRQPRRSALAGLGVWSFAAAAVLVAAWVLGLRLGQLLFGTPFSRTAAPFSVLPVSVLGDSFVLLSSTLLWAAIGFFAGGVVFTASQDPSEAAPTRPATRPLAWAFASAACAGVLWALGQVAALLVFDGWPSTENLIAKWERAFLQRIGIGVAVGFVVGLLSGWLLLGARPVKRWMIWTFGCTFLAGLGGAVCLLAEIACHGVLLPPIASSLGAAVAGFFGGLFAEGFSRRRTEDERSFDLDDEPPLGTTPDEPPHPSPRGDVRVRHRPRRRAPVLLFVPALTVSVLALIATWVVYPSLWSVLIGLNGLLGLSLVPIVWNQERRLAALEARFRVERET